MPGTCGSAGQRVRFSGVTVRYLDKRGTVVAAAQFHASHSKTHQHRSRWPSEGAKCTESIDKFDTAIKRREQ